MKKLLYLIPFLFIANLHAVADSFTSGVSLVKPATGVYDSNKRIDVKFNENFDIIGSTLNLAYIQINALHTSTGTFNGRFTDIAADTTTLSTTKLSSGSETVDSFHLKNTAVTAGEYGSASVSPKLTIDADGRITSVSSAAITSAASTLIPDSIYTLTVGTLGITGFYVDIATNNVYDAIVSASSTCNGKPCSVFFREGAYSVGTSTPEISRNMRVYGIEGSSTIWSVVGGANIVLKGDVNGMASISGITIDLDGRSFGSTILAQRSNSTFNKNKVINANRLIADLGQVLEVIDSTNVYNTNNIYDKFSYYREATNTLRAAFNVHWATSVFITGNQFLNPVALEADGHLFFVGDISDSKIDDNYWSNFDDYGFVIWGTSSRTSLIRNLSISNNKIDCFDSPSDAAFHIYDNTFQLFVSSGLVIANNEFNLKGAAVGVWVKFAGTDFIINPVIVNNKFRNIGTGAAGSCTFTSIAGNTANAVYIGNVVTGVSTFASDSGIGSKFATNDNFKDGIEQ